MPAGRRPAIVRAVIVGRLTPRAMTLRVGRAGIATGKLRLPAGVTRDQGCSGTVDVSGHRTALRRECTYRVRVGDRRRFVATFRGNRVLAPARSAVRPRGGANVI